MTYFLPPITMKLTTRILGLSVFFVALTPTAFARSIDDFVFPSSASSQSSSASSQADTAPSTIYTSSSSSKVKVDFRVRVKLQAPLTAEERAVMEGTLPETRAGFVSMIVRRLYNNVTIDTCFWNIASELPPDFTLVFTDVPVTHEYAKEICVAMNNGIIKGYADGSFRPNDRVTFAEASKMISRGYALNPWPDVTYSDPWFQQYVTTLDAKNAIPSSVTAFDQRMTRHDVGEILDRLDGRITTRSTTPLSALQQDWAMRFAQPVRRRIIAPVVRPVTTVPRSSSSASSVWSLIPASSLPSSSAASSAMVSSSSSAATSAAASSASQLPSSASSATSAATSSQASSAKSYPGWVY